jgi:AraC-like DNA-binding protein
VTPAGGNGTRFDPHGFSSPRPEARVTDSAFARAIVRRLARALDAADGAAVLDAGVLATSLVRREPDAGRAVRRAAAIVDAATLATAAPDVVRRRLEEGAEALAAAELAASADVADVLDALWRDVAGALAAPRAPDVLTAIQACLAERLHGQTRLNDLARALGYSPSHVSGLVRRLTGERFSALRRRLQLECARAALRRGTSVKQAAAEAGFADAGYFGRVFRRAVGVAPGRWRRLHAPPRRVFTKGAASRAAAGTPRAR